MISCFLAPAFASFALTRKYSKGVTAAAWAGTMAVYFAVVYLCFKLSTPMQYDWFLFFGWLVILPVPTVLLYKDKFSTKMFLSISAVFLANVTSFMSGSLTSVTYPIPPTSYWSNGADFLTFCQVFTGIKAAVTLAVASLVYVFLRKLVVSVFEILDGKMLRFLPIPLVASIGFFFLTQIVQAFGLNVGATLYFLSFYLIICGTFALLYWLVFSNATWSSRAMRTEAEMNVASKIQQDMLPQIFPTFDARDDFSIHAMMQPAKEVGGDFYDFFFVDENKLALVIADVSGKGVPAALFMVIAKTLIKDQAQTGIDPADVFTKANNLLCESNGEGMFVTAFMGVLDLPTGQLTYVNAGHNKPLIKQGDKYEWLEARPGFVLAGMEDVMYRQRTLQLKPGDKLYMYTDGVTEALNPNKDLYSDPRLLETINKAADMSVEETLPFIKNDIFTFANGADQADDITMLAIEYHGPESRKK